MGKQIIVTGNEAREKLIKGINAVADPVVSTLGPSGRNVIFNKNGIVHSTKDGVSVAKSINELEGEIENLGANLIKQASIKTLNDAGDGTTTSTLLTREIVNKGFKHLNYGANASDLKKGIDYATEQIIEFLREQVSEKITNQSQLKQIATISSNNDEEVGELVSNAISRVGMDGMVHIEESKTGETYLENVEGIQFEKGYSSHYFVTHNESMTCSLENPYVLLISSRLSKAKDIIPILESVANENKPILIIAEDIEGEALATLIVNKMRGTLKVVAVKAPDFGERRKLFMEDIAIMTGGQLIDHDKGMRLDRFDKKWLGTARIVNVTKHDTTIVDGKGEEQQVNFRIEEIQNQIQNSKTPFEREKLQERLAKLVGGVSIIHVGGYSEIEIKEKKDRVEDALHATKAAIEDGIIPGGGVALIHVKKLIQDKVIKELIQKFGPQSDVIFGAELVLDSISEPIYKILKNSGYKDMEIHEIVSTIKNKSSIKNPKFWSGYNLRTKKHEDLREAGIIDPTKVCIVALKNATSIAGTILLTEAVVATKEEKNTTNNSDGVDLSQFGFPG